MNSIGRQRLLLAGLALARRTNPEKGVRRRPKRHHAFTLCRTSRRRALAWTGALLRRMSVHGGGAVEKRKTVMHARRKSGWFDAADGRARMRVRWERCLR
jgi:hypothetical protein